MDWLKNLTEERRSSESGFTEAEARIRAEGGAYEIDLVADSEGKPISPVTVAAGDGTGFLRSSSHY